VTAPQIQLDIRISTSDPAVLAPLETAIQDLTPRRLEEHRDVATVLTVASTAVSVSTGLITLWKELKSFRHAPPVTVEAASGAELDLHTAASEAEIHQFVADAAQP
jgi:hypothetical protein